MNDEKNTVTLIVSGYGGRDAPMCGDGKVVCVDGEPFRIIGDHPENVWLGPDGWHVVSDPMARRVEAEPLDWDDVDDDEIAEDVRAHFDEASGGPVEMLACEPTEARAFRAAAKYLEAEESK
jgi:hypothetical protein